MVRWRRRRWSWRQGPCSSTASRRLDPAGTNLSCVIGQNVQRKYKTKKKVNFFAGDSPGSRAWRWAAPCWPTCPCILGGRAPFCRWSQSSCTAKKVKAQYRPSATRGSPNREWVSGCICEGIKKYICKTDEKRSSLNAWEASVSHDSHRPRKRWLHTGPCPTLCSLAVLLRFLLHGIYRKSKSTPGEKHFDSKNRY